MIATKQLPNGFVVREDNGLVAGHPALQRLPFERSIEPWVRSGFPEAEVVVLTDPSVSGTDIPMSTQGVVAIQAPKGTGKSKAIRDAVREQLPAKTSVVQVTFRRSLAWSSSHMMGSQSTLYSNVTDGPISARHHPRLTIVVNSITRIRGTYDVVVIDEIVSVMDMLSGTLLNASIRVQATSTLARLIGHARTVVIADAMLDASCLDFVMVCRRMAAAEGSWAPSPITVLDYVTRIHDDYSYMPYATMATWMRALDTAVTSGRKIVIPCMTKLQAQKIAARYADTHAVQLYTADTDAAVLQAHMADIASHWSVPQILVYSPVITAGCSFEVKHFDEVFFYGHAGLGSVRSAIQMIARVRDVQLKCVHVFISKCDSFAPVPAKAVVSPPLYSEVRTYQDGYMRLLDLLTNHRRMETTCAEVAFPYYFWSLVVHSGAKIVYPGDVGIRETVQEAEPPDVVMEEQELVPQVPARGYEHWWLHDWESDPQDVEQYTVGNVAVSVTGTVLERAGRMHPDHLHDVGLMPGGMRIVNRSVGQRLCPAWCTTELLPRFRSWCLLMARRSCTVMGAVVSKSDTWGPWQRQKGVPLVRSVTRHPPVCARVNSIKAPDMVARCKPHLDRYLDLSVSWLDVCQDTWVLAGMEVAVRQQPSVTSLFEPMPGGFFTEAMMISTRVNEVLSSFRPTAVHVNAALGNGRAALSRFEPAAALVDFIITDDKDAVHLVQCRVGGSPEVHGPHDLAKLAVLAATEDEPVSSVNVLYLEADRHLRLDLDELGTSMQGLARSSVSYVRAWNVSSAVGFMWCTSVDRPMVTVVSDGEPERVLTTVDDVLSLVSSGIRKRWISWGCVKWLQHRGASEGVVAPLSPSDLELAVQWRLRCDIPDVLSMDHAHVVGETRTTLPGMYFGLCKKRFLVYFWNGRPNGLYIPSLQGFDGCYMHAHD